MDGGGRSFRGDRPAAERASDLDLDSELDQDLDLDLWRPAPGKRALIHPLAAATRAAPSGPTATRLLEQACLYLRSAARKTLDALHAAASRGDTPAAERAWSEARQTLGLVEQCLKDAEVGAGEDPDASGIAEEVSATRSIRARLEARGTRLLADVQPERAIEAAWREEAAPLAAQLGVAPPIRADNEARQRTEARGARGLATGDGIFLHPTRIAPGTSEGRRVLIHELAHVAQAKRKREGAGVADRAAAEAEADAVAAGQRLAAPVLGIDLDERAAADKDASSGKQIVEPELPPDAPFLLVGPAGDVLISVAWLRKDGAADISQPKIYAPTRVPRILRELKKTVFWWMPESAIESSKEVWLKGPVDPTRKVVRTSMGPTLFRLIGLPPDVEVEWIFTPDGALEIISRGALSRVLEVMPDGMSRGEIPAEVESLSIRRLHGRAGLPPPRGHMSMLRDAVMRKSSAAYVTEYPAEYMRVILGPRWDAISKRPADPDATTSHFGGVAFDSAISIEDREYFIAWTRRVYGSVPSGMAAPPDPATITQLREIDRHALSARILERLRHSSPDGSVLDWSALRQVINDVEQEAAHERFGLKDAESPKGKGGRFFERPISGKVRVLGSAAWVGQELEVEFSTTDQPGPGFVAVSVRWIATPFDKPDQRLRVGRTSHFAHHDPERWKVGFDKVGLYRIIAFVDHQSYWPAHFDDTLIEVKTEQERLEEVENEAFADLGARTSRKGRSEFFEHSWLNDRAGADKYSFGKLTEGEVPADFEHRSMEERIAFIADDRAKLQRLIEAYKGEKRTRPRPPT